MENRKILSQNLSDLEIIRMASLMIDKDRQKSLIEDELYYTIPIER